MTLYRKNIGGVQQAIRVAVGACIVALAIGKVANIGMLRAYMPYLSVV